jgi:hypothetical protein
MRATPPNVVASNAVMSMLLDEGHTLVWMSTNAGWPSRQIRVFASRHGYLFTADGTPFKPPAHGDYPLPLAGVRST